MTDTINLDITYMLSLTEMNNMLENAKVPNKQCSTVNSGVSHEKKTKLYDSGCNVTTTGLCLASGVK